MQIIKVENRKCICCMEQHDVKMVRFMDKTLYDDTWVEYEVESFYCEVADEYYDDEQMISSNNKSLKDAYRRQKGLLTSGEIRDIRSNYEITQGDMCVLLGWGGKTITRYETHQIQDKAHDLILRKIEQDPMWFTHLLIEKESDFSAERYKKYLQAAAIMYEQKQDVYLKESIYARYIKLQKQDNYTGNVGLDLEKVVDVICYFANSPDVNMLYKVKLMKLLWYADALAYKTYGKAITGLVYQAMSMGAVPIAHDLIMQLKGVPCETIENGDNVSYKLIKSSNVSYGSLSDDDRMILDKIIERLGMLSKDEIVDYMHKEIAYQETEAKAIIDYKYANLLSI